MASQETFEFRILCKYKKLFYLAHQGPIGADAVQASCPQQHTHEPKPLEPPWLTNPKYKGYKRKDILKRKQKQSQYIIL